MTTAIWWWHAVTTFLPLWWRGEDYYLLPRRSVARSWFIARTVADAITRCKHKSYIARRFPVDFP